MVFVFVSTNSVIEHSTIPKTRPKYLVLRAGLTMCQIWYCEISNLEKTIFVDLIFVSFSFDQICK